MCDSNIWSFCWNICFEFSSTELNFWRQAFWMVEIVAKFCFYSGRYYIMWHVAFTQPNSTQTDTFQDLQLIWLCKFIKAKLQPCFWLLTFISSGCWGLYFDAKFWIKTNILSHVVFLPFTVLIFHIHLQSTSVAIMSTETFFLYFFQSDSRLMHAFYSFLNECNWIRWMTNRDTIKKYKVCLLNLIVFVENAF